MIEPLALEPQVIGPDGIALRTSLGRTHEPQTLRQSVAFRRRVLEERRVRKTLWSPLPFGRIEIQHLILIDVVRNDSSRREAGVMGSSDLGRLSRSIQVRADCRPI